MKIIVTHTSPDWDAIGSVWLLKRFLPGWQDATVSFVPAGQRYKNQDLKSTSEKLTETIEKVGDDEIIHVDTGLGPLDHHQTSDLKICAATRVWDYVRDELSKAGQPVKKDQEMAITRVVNVILEDDHFREVFWADPMADFHEFSLIGLMEGFKLSRPGEDMFYVEFGIQCLDAVTHTFESRIWSEKEIEQNGIPFEIKKGKAMAFETINDGVIKLAQKMGYLMVVRKDPRKGYVRIKVRPAEGSKDDLDLTLAYEKLSKVDTEATWFLHVSKKMLLNGTPKNPKMIPTKLTLTQIVDVLKSIY